MRFDVSQMLDRGPLMRVLFTHMHACSLPPDTAHTLASTSNPCFSNADIKLPCNAKDLLPTCCDQESRAHVT